MRICVTAVGTHGDVLPMLALAAGLRRANHFVRFATTSLYENEVRASGVEFYRIDGNPQGFFGGKGGRALREMFRRPLQFQRFWNICLAPYARKHLLETWQACKGFDAAVCLPWFHAAPSLSEKLGMPCFAATVMPIVGLPTSEMPNPMEGGLPGASSGKSYRRSWRSSTMIAAAPYEQVNRWRVDVLGLRALSRKEALRSYRRTGFLLSYSQSVLPRPADWPASVHVTGFWFIEPQQERPMSPALVRFLDANPKPILIGFSSQVACNPQAFTEKITQAAVRSRKSAILLTGWGGLRQADLPSNILVQEWAPYGRLVPLLSGFVHHGGCGSMALCLRHGVPNMAIPFGMDQTLWGQRIADLGLGPAPVAPDRIDVNSLADALVQMTEDDGIAERARAMARKIQSEDGVLTAVKAIEKALGVSPAPS